MIKATIVDDEPPARRELARLLARYEDLSVVGEAGDLEFAVALHPRRVTDREHVHAQHEVPPDGLASVRKLRPHRLFDHVRNAGHVEQPAGFGDELFVNSAPAHAGVGALNERVPGLTWWAGMDYFRRKA